jgi:hypothetical protein
MKNAARRSGVCKQKRPLEAGAAISLTGAACYVTLPAMARSIDNNSYTSRSN